jgi:hypothetical protein
MRQDELEEIRKRGAFPDLADEDLSLHERDRRKLLVEVDRLRKIEIAARELFEAHQIYPGDPSWGAYNKLIALYACVEAAP